MPWFSQREVDLVARLSPHVAHGIRTGLLLDESWADRSVDGPGLVVLDDRGAIESATLRALEWLGPVEDGQLAGSVVVHEVAAQARALADGLRASGARVEHTVLPVGHGLSQTDLTLARAWMAGRDA